jgi:hypothetical protein
VKEWPKCGRKGCLVPAAYEVKIHLWAKGHTPETSPPSVMQPKGLYVCDIHKLFPLPIEDWFKTEKARDSIDAAFDASNKARPDYDTAAYVYNPLLAKKI